MYGLPSLGHAVTAVTGLPGPDVQAPLGARREREAVRDPGRRTTHRSASGKKLYAVRDAKGRFKDIQTYERAHRADLRQKAKGEQ